MNKNDKEPRITWLPPEAQMIFKNAGLATFADFLDSAKTLGEPLTKVMREHRDKQGSGKIDRSVVRFNLNGNVFYMKQASGTAYSNIVNEFDAIHALPRFGLRPPELAAHAFDETQRKALIILKDLDGFNSINDMFNGNADSNAVADFTSRKELILERIAKIIKNVHKSNYLYPDWFAKHLFIKPGCDDIALIDLERFRPLGKCPWYFGFPVTSFFVKRKILRKLRRSLKSDLLPDAMLKKIF